MATELTNSDTAPLSDPREVFQEHHEGTIDTTASTGSITFALTGELKSNLFGTASSPSATATVSSLSVSSMTVAVASATASEVAFTAVATDHVWESA